MFPTWLSPTQVHMLTISEKHAAYAAELAANLREAGVRVQVDDSDDTIGKKLRTHRKMRPAYLLILGESEVEGRTVTYLGPIAKTRACPRRVPQRILEPASAAEVHRALCCVTTARDSVVCFYILEQSCPMSDIRVALVNQAFVPPGMVIGETGAHLPSLGLLMLASAIEEADAGMKVAYFDEEHLE